MGIVLAVISGKGGVGKTTTAANIAIGIAQEGKRTVVVDFDIGQRNLDMILGLESRVVYDIVHLMDKEAKLPQALIRDKKDKNLYFLAASQTKDKTVLNKDRVERFIKELKENFDYIILDSPAGIESGFEHTIAFADEAIVVVNPEVSSIRDADRAIGIVDSKSQKVQNNQEVKKHLIINRINPEMIAKNEMLTTEDILEILAIKLLGKIPEDKKIVEASNSGVPVIYDKKSIAGEAYKRVAMRIAGKNVAFKDIEKVNTSMMSKFKGLFK